MYISQNRSIQQSAFAKTELHWKEIALEMSCLVT